MHYVHFPFFHFFMLLKWLCLRENLLFWYVYKSCLPFGIASPIFFLMFLLQENSTVFLCISRNGPE